MPDRSLLDATVGETPTHENLQQLVEAETGRGTQGILRRWQASDSALVVLTSDQTGVKISRDNGTTAPSQVMVDGTPAGGNLSGTYPNPTLAAASIDALLPPGTIQAYAGAGFPAGWLPCNGSAISRAGAPKLFAVIGTTYNTGGEAGTDFRLPNLNGRVILGAAGSHPLAQVGGAETVPGPLHTHPGTHSHVLLDHAHGPGLHTHGLGSHVHAQSTHTHGLNGHAHDLNGHTHSLAHDHPTQLSELPPTGTLVPVTAGTLSVSVDTHRHNVDVAALGATASGGSSGDTAGSSADTAGPTAANTGPPSASAATVSDGPSAVDTAPAAGTMQTDNAAHAASYGASTIPTMMPFLSISYIIRTGA